MTTLGSPLLLLAMASVLAAATGPTNWHVEAEGLNLVNVKDYGAVGDGVADDTAAINRAFSETIDRSRYRNNAFVYLPDGTYKVTGPIEGRILGAGDERDQGKVWSAGWRSMMLLIGESREGTVIKLADNAPGYGDPDKPKWVVACGSEGDKRDNQGGGGNRAFRHTILNLTVDVGSGNPGAIGVDFIASNRGAVEGVTIRSGDGSGRCALRMTRHWPGPALICDVALEGFDYGIEIGHYQYGMTFEHLTMRGQRVAGIKNQHNVLAMRKVDFAGEVPFYRSGSSKHAMLVLLDSDLRGGPGTADAPAIDTRAFVNLRRVRVEGFGQVVKGTTKEGGPTLAAEAAGTTEIDSWDHGSRVDGAGRDPTWLDLPIEEQPIIRPGPGDEWVIAGAGEGDLPLQEAIDSGAEFIYLKPLAAVDVGDEPIVLRNKVKLIMGLSGHIKADGGKVALRIEDGASDVVVLENVYIDGRVEHVADRTFGLRHGDIHGGSIGLDASGSGTTHIVDVIGKGYQIGVDHTLFARQLNAEFGSTPLLTNAGTSWVLGFKMESSSAGSKDAPHGTPSLVNRDGGRLEVLGALLYTLGSRDHHTPKVSAFTNEGGDLAVSFRHNGIPKTWYRKLLRTGDPLEGEVVISGDDVRGNGAALLSDQR